MLKPEAIETLNLWLHAPQSDWLKRQGIEAGEWCDAVDDLSPLSMDELNRHQLIRERLAEQLISSLTIPTRAGSSSTKWTGGRGAVDRA